MQNMEGILEKITKRLDFKIPKYKEVKKSKLKLRIHGIIFK
jgi:hypothetical protein